MGRSVTLALHHLLTLQYWPHRPQVITTTEMLRLISALPLLSVLSVLSLSSCCSSRLRPRYVSPVPLENCIACEQESSDWSWGLKMVWFLVTVVTHIQYECCHVQVEPASIRLFRRRWTSVADCGKRGKSLRRLQRENNNTEAELRTVGGSETGEHEVPWQVALLREDGTWDGCGGLLLNCDPPVILTAAHCVQRSVYCTVTVYRGQSTVQSLRS